MDSANADKKRTSNLRLAIASIGIAVFTALLIAEVAVRILLPYNSPDTIREHSVGYITAAYAPYLLEPVGRLVDIDDEKAWGSKPVDAPTDELLFISEQGYRGPSFDVRKPPGTTRIIVLGGSAVFDQNVRDTYDDIERTWPHRIGKHLRDDGLDNVEVINAGVPGYTSADSLGRLFTQLWMYEPDVILVYHGWNDIKFWKQHPISPEQPLISHVKPYDPASNPFTTYRGAIDRALGYSQLYMKLRNRYFLWQTNVGAEGARAGERSAERADAYSQFGPEQFRLNLELIVRASRSIGARPVLITQATLVAADNTDADIARIAFDYQGLSHAAIVRAYEDTYKVINDIGASNDAEVIDITGLMNGKGQYFSDHAHVSPEGSVRLAEIIAEQLGSILAAQAPGDRESDE